VQGRTNLYNENPHILISFRSQLVELAVPVTIGAGALFAIHHAASQLAATVMGVFTREGVMIFGWSIAQY
jgi:hypothetical protein